jgi:hypothetical protein
VFNLNLKLFAMKNSVKLILASLVVSSLSLMVGCQKEDNPVVSSENSNPVLKNQMLNTFYGPTVPLGNGVARAWVSVNKNGDPTAVGISLSEKALDKLPLVATSYVLPLPKNKGMNFYTHGYLDWNPQGHPPVGIYDVPHFDFHFYIISSEARMAIGPNDDAQFLNYPAPIYVPPMYMPAPPGVPQMGLHWVDLLAPEFNGGIFTKTFIWGSYDGAFIFWEPMVTRTYLLSHPMDEITLRQPQAFQRDGWYAGKYKVWYSASPGEYTVALTDLTFHMGE